MNNNYELPAYRDRLCCLQSSYRAFCVQRCNTEKIGVSAACVNAISIEFHQQLFKAALQLVDDYRDLFDHFSHQLITDSIARGSARDLLIELSSALDFR